MKALVYRGPGLKSWRDVPDPVIQHSTDAIVRVDAVTICGTDLPIDRRAVEDAANNRTSVTRRTSLGGTAPSEVLRMVQKQRQQGEQLSRSLQTMYRRWKAADDKLVVACENL